jgi:FkbM family methyltransferase
MFIFLSKLFKNHLLFKKIGFFEFVRLKLHKKFEITHTFFQGTKLQLIDSSSYLILINEIFIDEIYKFDSNTTTPIIFDCGANIGLATIYFKKIYPDSIVIAYEPDPQIFHTLNSNIVSYGFDNVLLMNKAISNYDGYCEFKSEGGLSGMISDETKPNNISVKTERLKNKLSEFPTIDFLKIDIEGHEDIVINDIVDQLPKIQNIFLEYHSFIHKPQNLGQILQILSDAGFRYYFKESDYKKHPFINKLLFHEIDTVVNIFCYK